MNSSNDDELLESLRRLYPDERDTLSFTRNGIWLATPLEVLVLCAIQLSRWNLVTDGATVLDAGSGDGRVLASLALTFPNLPGLRLIGIECDATLVAASKTLDLLPKPLIREGDFLGGETFADLEIPFSEVDLFMHYPDGNETALHRRFVEEAKPSAHLALLSPQLSPVLSTPPRLSARLHPPRLGVQWTLAVYEPSTIL